MDWCVHLSLVRLQSRQKQFGRGTLCVKQPEACNHGFGDGGKALQLCVSIVPIFNHLEPEEMEEVVKTTRPVSLRRGDFLYSAGDASDALSIIHRGKVKVYRLAENGKEQLIRILDAGDFTGELALFTETIHDAYAEAMEETEICSIQRPALQELLTKYPNISMKILTEFSRRLNEAENQMTSFTTEDVETRIALYLAEQVEESRSMEIQLKMTRKDLASYLGTTPETISRKLAKFEDEGWIVQMGQRTIRILDLDALLLL